MAKRGAIALIGAAAELRFFTPDQPAQLVLILFTAVRAGQKVGALLCLLVEKVSFFHRALTSIPTGVGCKNSVFHSGR